MEKGDWRQNNRWSVHMESLFMTSQGACSDNGYVTESEGRIFSLLRSKGHPSDSSAGPSEESVV